MPRIIPAISVTEHAYTIDEACAFFGGVTRQTIWQFTRKRGLPSRRIGGRVYYLESDLRKFTQPVEAQPKPDLRQGKTSETTLAKLRSQGFDV